MVWCHLVPTELRDQSHQVGKWVLLGHYNGFEG